MIMADLASYFPHAHWAWLTAGIFLLAAEMIAPGFFLIWVGGAAILTGLITGLLPISLPYQFGIFALLSVGLVSAARRWWLRSDPQSDAPLLNKRIEQMLGQSVEVVEPIHPSGGRVKIGDSVWPAKGPPLPVGSVAKVQGWESGLLIVEPVSPE